MLSGGAVALALLLAGAGGAWWAYNAMARPWLDARAADLVDEHPAVGTGLEPAASGAGSAADAPPAARVGSVREGTTRPDEFPQDVYLPPHAAAPTFRTTERAAVAVLLVRREPLDRVADEYRREMTRRGWQPQPGSELSDGLRLRFTRPDAETSVELVRRGTDTEVWIRRESSIP